MGQVLAEQVQGENAQVPWVLQFTWASTVASFTVTAYKNGSDVSSTVLSGSVTTSGTNVTLKTLGTGIIGGELYMLDVVGTVDGVVDEWWLPVRVLKKQTGKTT